VLEVLMRTVERTFFLLKLLGAVEFSLGVLRDRGVQAKNFTILGKNSLQTH
jgi:hypothetical protein